jgi:hypothetical protein
MNLVVRRGVLGACLATTLACSGAGEGPAGPLGAGSLGAPGNAVTNGAPGGNPSGVGGNLGGVPGAQTSGDAGVVISGDPPAGLGTGIFAQCAGGQEVPGPRLLRLMTRREYENTVKDLLYVQEVDVSTLPLEARVQGFDNNATALVVTSRHADAYLALGEDLAKDAVDRSRGQLLPCDPNQNDCARTFVERFGTRAFRRPLTTEESTRYQALFADDLTEGDFNEGMRLVIKAMLSSPSFLYRSEVGTRQADGTYRLTPYEVASALSYLYWGSMPDQTLFDAAKNDQLKTPEQLSAQADRMLNDNHAKEQLGEFSIQWLRSEGVISANKDKAIYPNFNDSLRTAMIEEQKRFFTRVVLEERGGFAELFTPSFTLVNRELASFYGLPAPANDYDKVAVGDSGRGGVLGFGAVLASHAHQNESSPIKRGLYVRDRLLCQVLPRPPANLNTNPPGLDPTLTTRVRFARHTADPACHNCHQYIDGVGFGLEGFDGVGQQRSMENGMPVDTSGEILGVEKLTPDTSTAFHGPRELAAILRDSDAAKACLTLQYFRFGRGYEERDSDACSLSALKSRFEASSLSVRELLATLPLLRSFTVRSAE